MAERRFAQTRMIIAAYLKGDDKQHLEAISDLVWMGMLIRMVAFQCEPARRDAKKTELLALLDGGSADFPTTVRRCSVFGLSISLPQIDDEIPTYMDLVNVMEMYRTYINRRPGPSAEALLYWVAASWEKGEEQREVFEHNIEGPMCRSDESPIENMAAHLANEGIKRKLLP